MVGWLVDQDRVADATSGDAVEERRMNHAANKERSARPFRPAPFPEESTPPVQRKGVDNFHSSNNEKNNEKSCKYGLAGFCAQCILLFYRMELSQNWATFIAVLACCIRMSTAVLVCIETPAFLPVLLACFPTHSLVSTL